jgi:hypothetical protein
MNQNQDCEFPGIKPSPPGLGPSTRTPGAPDSVIAAASGATFVIQPREAVTRFEPNEWQTYSRQEERLELLERICRLVELKVAQRIPVRAALKWAARRYAGHHYRDVHRAQLSAWTLLRVYYRWLKRGRNIEYAGWKFKTRQTLPAPVVVAAFERALFASGTTSPHQAWRRVRKDGNLRELAKLPYATVCRSVPRSILRAARKLQLAQKQLNRARRCAEQILQPNPNGKGGA